MADAGGVLDPIVREAQDRFDREAKRSHDAYAHWLDDYKFAHADAYNAYQWPEKYYKERVLDDRPCLTINKTRQHNLQIKNDAKQNKPGIKFRATGGGASFASAQMFDAIGRHIEYQSHAGDIYDLATGHMVDGGFGWMRLTTDYADDTSFDQEIFIRPINDALGVYLDSDAKEPDKSDANFGFVFAEHDREEYVRKHPARKEYASDVPLEGVRGWLSENRIREAEYYRRVEVADTLFAVPRADGEMGIIRASEIAKSDPEMLAALRADPEVKSRIATTYRVEYFLIVGQRIAERSVWPGQYIPLIKVYGEETIIEGKVDVKSHTRALIDPQRMYNYWSSAAVEYGALQTKMPWIASAESIEGYEAYWKAANISNFAYLPYNAIDDGGQKLDKPERVQPPVAAPVALEGMRIAQTEMMLVSGQYESVMGQGSNERSGKAINERQRAGENATYHFINGLGVAIRNLGRQILDLAPKVYDTKRVLQIAAVDGTPMELQIDPKASAALQMRIAQDGATAVRIFNPAVGKYEVEADIGPGYGTKRQETANALTVLLTQAPQLTAIIGDLLLRSLDFHLADEAAARLRRMVPSYALGEGPTPSEQTLSAQLAKMGELLAKALEELALEKLKVKGKEQQRDIGVFEALTKRIKVLVDAQRAAGEEGGGEVDEEAIRVLVGQAMEEMLGASLQPVLDANAAAHEAGAHEDAMQLALPGMLGTAKPPVPGAKLDPNGRWYLPQVSARKGMIPLA